MLFDLFFELETSMSGRRKIEVAPGRGQLMRRGFKGGATRLFIVLTLGQVM